MRGKWQEHRHGGGGRGSEVEVDVGGGAILREVGGLSRPHAMPNNKDL